MQDQKMKLTKREKKLLILTGIFGFVALMIMVVILPLNENLTESRSLYGELSVRRSQIEIELASESVIREEHAQAQYDLAQIQTQYSDESLASEIGLMLTQKVTQHNLEPISQSISQPVDFVAPAYDWEEALQPVFKSMTVSMVVSGSYNDVQRLLNSVENIQFQRVSIINLRFTRVEGATTLAGNVNLTFDLLMLGDDAAT